MLGRRCIISVSTHTWRLLMTLSKHLNSSNASSLHHASKPGTSAPFKQKILRRIHTASLELNYGLFAPGSNTRDPVRQVPLWVFGFWADIIPKYSVKNPTPDFPTRRLTPSFKARATCSFRLTIISPSTAACFISNWHTDVQVALLYSLRKLRLMVVSQDCTALVRATANSVPVSHT